MYSVRSYKTNNVATSLKYFLTLFNRTISILLMYTEWCQIDNCLEMTGMWHSCGKSLGLKLLSN